MGVFAKRSVMQLYALEDDDYYAHRIRIVLNEKGVAYEMNQIVGGDLPEEVMDSAPDGKLPILLDRDSVLYYTDVILEYLDERFPHPPLLPVYPVSRARIRQLINRVEEDLSPLVCSLLDKETSQTRKIKDRKDLRQNLMDMAPIFDDFPEDMLFFFSESYTLLDACMAPILWNLTLMEIELPQKTIKSLKPYMDRLFQRDAFKYSLLDYEKELYIT